MNYMTYMTYILFLLFLNNVAFASSSEETAPAIHMSTWQAPNWQSYKALGYDVNTFAVPDGLKKDVDFWIKIYSHYTTEQGVYHITGDTEQILGEIDLTQVYANPKWSRVRKELESEILIKRQKKLLAAKFKVDVKKIRLQMGLKDRMAEAIKISGRYLPMMERIFEQEQIPKELTRVVFVESSFNIFAQSKVGASGLWQIMPNIGRKFKYITDYQDLRNHPVYATKVAAKILKENYQILKSWPLAVTAYNHGVGSLSKLIKKYKTNDISDLINSVNSKKSFGFASKNFYATFLASLYVESHANLYFPEPIYQLEEDNLRAIKLTQKVLAKDILSIFKNNLSEFRRTNPHIKISYLKSKKHLPAGTTLNISKNLNLRLAETKIESSSPEL